MDAATYALFELAYQYYEQPSRYQPDIDRYQVNDQALVSLTSLLDQGADNHARLAELSKSLKIDDQLARALILHFLRAYLANSSRDYYQALGVTNSASQDVIKEQYRRLIAIFHPDKNPHDAPIAASINEAYNILKKVGSRKDYDKLNRENRQKEAVASAFQQKNWPRKDASHATSASSLMDILWAIPGFRRKPKLFIWSAVLIIVFAIPLLVFTSGEGIRPPSYVYSTSPRDDTSIGEVNKHNATERQDIEPLRDTVKIDTPAIERLLSTLGSNQAVQQSQEQLPKQSDGLISGALANMEITDIASPAPEDPGHFESGMDVVPDVAELGPIVAAPAVKAQDEPEDSGTLGDAVASEAKTGDGSVSSAAVPVDDKADSIPSTGQNNAVATPLPPRTVNKNTPEELVASLLTDLGYIAGIPSPSSDNAKEDAIHLVSGTMPPELVFMRYISQLEAGDINGILQILPADIVSVDGGGTTAIPEAYRRLFTKTSHRAIFIKELTVDEVVPGNYLLVCKFVLQLRIYGNPQDVVLNSELSMRMTNERDTYKITQTHYRPD